LDLKSIKYLGKFKRLGVKSIASRSGYGTIYSGLISEGAEEIVVFKAGSTA
jgi:hypothetical protein